MPPPWPDATRVLHGDLSFDMAPEGVRHLTVRGTEALAALYPAVRRTDWSTVEFAWTDDGSRREDPEIPVRRTARSGALECSWTMRARSSGRVTATFELTAREVVELNRWGFCILLDTAAWSGATVAGPSDAGTLPVEVAPQVIRDGPVGLFAPCERLQVVRQDGVVVRLSSDSLLLELEDQRNWTDPTYKIYSGSLLEPRPITLAAGDVVTQVLELDVELPRTTGVPPTDARQHSRLVLGPPTPLPSVGVQLNDENDFDEQTRDRLLRELAVDHVRVDVEWPVVPRHLASVVASGVPVELAVLTEQVDRDTLAGVAELAASLPPRSRLLLHRTGRRTTDRATSESLAGLLEERSDVSVVIGSDAYFADINRDRPEGSPVSFSITPTVHAFDSETIFATLPIQQLVVAQARDSLSAEIVVSPVTMRLRGDPESPAAPPDARRRIDMRHVDGRLHTLEGAAWLLGSICALTAGGAKSGTWHELLGRRGLVAADSRRPSPAYLAMAALQAASRPHVRTVSAQDGGVVGLLFDESRLLLASLRPWRQEITLDAVVRSSTCVRRALPDEPSAGAAGVDWWQPSDGDRAGTSWLLEPFAVWSVRW